MSKIKTNRFQQAIVELSELDKNQLKKINEEIDAKDSKYYHVAMITIITREGQAKNDVKVNVGKFHEQNFKKLEKNFVFFGYTKLIILHDPNLPIEGVEIKTEQTIENVSSKTSMTEEEMEAEIERRAKEKADAHIESLNLQEPKTGAVEGGGKQEDSGKGKEKKEIPNPFANGTTKAPMIEFATANNIDLSGVKTQPEIELVLKTWYDEQVEEANKQ